jgi:hypothetical protein
MNPDIQASHTIPKEDWKFLGWVPAFVFNKSLSSSETLVFVS